MSRPCVLITEHLSEGCYAWLAERTRVLWLGRDGVLGSVDQLPVELRAEIQGLVVRTYTQVDGAFLERLPNVRVIGRAGVGLDNFDLPACRRRGVEVVYTPDANSQAVVEYVLALIFDAIRPRVNLEGPDAADPARFHHLRQVAAGAQLDGLTVGVVGFGRIGKRLGHVLAALGVELLVNDLLPESELRRGVEYDFSFVEKPDLYGRSDIITFHVDGRPENRHLIGRAALDLIQPGALLINSARGMLVDAAALADWLRAHADDGAQAILDVHDPEPFRPDYPLLGLTNCRLLPHLASRTHEALENMSWVVRDVVAVLEGRAPQYPA